MLQRVAGITYRRLYVPAKNRTTAGSYESRTYQTKTSKEPFLNGSSSTYVEEMYKAWLKDPESVHKSWDAFFRSTSEGLEPGVAYQSPPLAPVQYVHVPVGSVQGSAMTSLTPMATTPQYVEPRGIEDHLSVQAIIRSYQVRGHLVSKLDPLNITAANIHSAFSEGSPSSPQVVLRSYQLGKDDLLRLSLKNK